MATRLAIDMVASYGLAGPEPLVYWGKGVRPSQLPPSLFTEVRRELNSAYMEACDLIQEYRLAVSHLSTFLMVHLAASDEDIRTIIREQSGLSGTDTRH
jgi:hypothetical protein